MSLTTRQRKIRAQRYEEAAALIDRVRETVKFARIDVLVDNTNRHWRFSFGGQHLLDYWPSTSRCRPCGQRGSNTCRGPMKAARLALDLRADLLAQIQLALQPGVS